MFKSRQDRLKKGILDQPQDSFPSAGLGRLDIPGDRGLCCHFFPRAILQQTGNASDKSFVKFSKHTFFAILSLIIDFHVAEKRLHIAIDLALSNLDFGVKRKHTGNHIKVAVSAKKIIHSAHVGVVDGKNQIEIGTLVFRAKGKFDLSWPASHKLGLRLSAGDAVF